MIELVITAVIRGLSLFLCMESKEDVSISLENGQEERQNDLIIKKSWKGEGWRSIKYAAFHANS